MAKTKQESHNRLSSQKISAVCNKIDNLTDYPAFDNYLNLDWGKWACAADWHLPFVEKKVFKDLIKQCGKRKVRNLLIGGDFFDLNAFCHYFSHTKVDWKHERDFAKDVMSILQDSFSKIAIMISNHEVRYLKNLQKSGTGDILDIYTLIGVDVKKVPITIANKCFVRDWVVIHPKNARKSPLSYAREKSNSYKDKHIVITHAHMQAQCKDPSNKYHLIDLGLMGDASKIEYKSLNDTAHYEWNNGFLIVDDNRPTLYGF